MHLIKSLSLSIMVILLIACAPKTLPESYLQAETSELITDEQITEQPVQENPVLSEYFINSLNLQFESDLRDRIEMIKAEKLYHERTEKKLAFEQDTEPTISITESDNNLVTTVINSSEQPQADSLLAKPQEIFMVEPIPVPEPKTPQEPQEISPADQVIETQTPVAPQEPFEPSRVMDLGNSGMEFATMDKAEMWAGNQMLNPESPWSGRNGWNGWFTISVAYQVDASGGIDNNYSYTVDFYK